MTLLCKSYSLKYPPLLPTNNSKEDSPRKPLGGGSSGGGGASAGGADRLKRDEWSEGAVSSLLEAYETKWVLRNRAKLKGHDWEEVARHVSSRANCTKSPKTQTQCKNKIESMKKRYRSESATPDASSWPLFQRLDLLLRGSGAPPMPPPVTTPLMLLETLPPQPPPPPSQPPHHLMITQNSHESNGLHRPAKRQGEIEVQENKDENREEEEAKKEDWEVAESIRWLAEVVVRSEQARMDTMRELERMRVEADAKRGEMDLKRTEIIANTQLEIARLFAGSGKGVDSSLRIGRS
ncbi:hypothetical protein AAG906_022625 [Vitis piasezkii]